MRILWSVLVWTAIAAITAVYAIVVILSALLFFPVDRNLRIAQLGATLWAHSCFLANPRWRLEVRGRDNLKKAGPAVICSNHTSQVDILAISALHGNWRWVSKREIFYFPFLGWAMWAIGTPSVKRGDKESGQKMLAHCRRWLDRGVSILIFPEGRRTDTGELQPFKPGAFKLALEASRPVVPIVIVGASEALPKKGFDVSRPAKVVVSVLPAIDSTPWKEAFDVDGFAAHVRSKMTEELGRSQDLFVA
jgi:1-acyl-sn-glycerol-3-phosphate acyltransferase